MRGPWHHPDDEAIAQSVGMDKQKTKQEKNDN